MLSNLSAKIEEIANPIVLESGCYIVEVNIRGERSSKVVELFVESDSGVTIDQCVKISRELAPKLDSDEIITGRYRLDVSSPGLDRPLKLRRQYIKNIGKRCKVDVMENGIKKSVVGELTSLDGNTLSLLSENSSHSILFDDIIETFILPKF
jgi:ribosome maturation factor RimP